MRAEGCRGGCAGERVPGSCEVGCEELRTRVSNRVDEGAPVREDSDGFRVVRGHIFNLLKSLRVLGQRMP